MWKNNFYFLFLYKRENCNIYYYHESLISINFSFIRAYIFNNIFIFIIIYFNRKNYKKDPPKIQNKIYK